MLASHLRDDIIIPCLTYLQNGIDLRLNSESAINLMLGTPAVETDMGKYLHQIKGSALGLYQIEPTTHDLVVEWLQKEYPKLYTRVKLLQVSSSEISEIEELKFNLYYQTAIARCLYYSIKEPLPLADDLYALATYWKRYYNTEKGKGKVCDFVTNYKKYVEGET